jgi:hypothetical protein
LPQQSSKNGLKRIAPKDAIEHLDLVIVEAIGTGNEKIGDAS